MWIAFEIATVLSVASSGEMPSGAGWTNAPGAR